MDAAQKLPDRIKEKLFCFTENASGAFVSTSIPQTATNFYAKC